MKRQKSADHRDIHAFAEKWLKKHQDQQYSEIESEFGNECIALGIQMDCGKAFSAAFPNSEPSLNKENLEKIIGQTEDISLLSGAIFSQWRYFTHWSMEPYDFDWFISALTRLLELTAPKK